MTLFFKVPENLMREILRNFNKLVKDLQSQDYPEAMAYLRIMGAELGFIKSSDLEGMAQNALMYTELLMKTLPTMVQSCTILTHSYNVCLAALLLHQIKQ